MSKRKPTQDEFEALERENRRLRDLLETNCVYEEKFRALVEHSMVGIYIIQDNRVQYCNPRMEEIYGYSREEMYAWDTPLKAVAPEDLELARENVRKRFSGEVPIIRYTLKIVRKDGERRILDVFGSRILHQGKPAIIGSIVDQTEQKIAEQALHESLVKEKQARTDAQEAVRVRDEFLSIASHELRTPLAAMILGFQMVEVALRRANLDPATADTVKKLLPRLGLPLGRFKNLVSDLMDLSALDSGQLLLRREPVDLAELVEQMVQEFAPELERIGCVVSLTRKGDAVGNWDPTRLEQVLNNLLVNAMKFGPGKPIEIEIASTGKTALVRITDHGIGISRQAQLRIFEKFERAVSAKNYGGLGLGLYLSHQIVRAHGGALSVQSDEGRGATFTVELPMGEAPARAPGFPG